MLILSKLRQSSSIQVCIDLVKMVHELTLQVIPHFRLMLCQSQLKPHTRMILRRLTVQLASPLHRIICQGKHHTRLEHEC